jgi:hypothetical protein
MARALFVLVPALLVGGLFTILHPAIGLMAAGAMIGLGLDVTEPRPDRGERR